MHYTLGAVQIILFQKLISFLISEKEVVPFAVLQYMQLLQPFSILSENLNNFLVLLMHYDNQSIDSTYTFNHKKINV